MNIQRIAASLHELAYEIEEDTAPDTAFKVTLERPGERPVIQGGNPGPFPTTSAPHPTPQMQAMISVLEGEVTRTISLVDSLVVRLSPVTNPLEATGIPCELPYVVPLADDVRIQQRRLMGANDVLMTLLAAVEL